MADLAGGYHWQPSELNELDWQELLDFRRDMPRVLKATGRLH
ncbi:MAG: phage tail protein [Stappia sp.]|nr:GpE family phage tail protein [Stappia sp.]MAA97769.1 phage tail protein [Stappia sp.]MBM20000.1 phage tail protein [Stappia sp.]